jgi:NAD(P)H-dependent FMN reductase
MTPTMTTIIGLSGSLRRLSFNTALLRAAAAMMPDGAVLDVRTLHGIPVYNADDEAEHGTPPLVAELKNAITAADGLLLATPEYNHSIPGGLKNGIDWLSRPPSDIKRIFGGKPVAIVGVSNGAFATVLSQAAWLPVMRALGVSLWAGGRLAIPRGSSVFDQDGALIDEGIREQLRAFVTGFVAFIK